MVISHRPSHLLHAAGRCSAALAMLCAWHAPSFGQTGPALDFERALRVAQQNSPLLQARAATTQGAAALQTSAALLPDPKLSLGIADFPVSGPSRGSLTRDNFTMRQIGFMQDVPNRAKRAARADMALARTDKERAMERIDALAVRRETGLAWLARLYAEKRLALIDTLLSEQNRLVETAPAQYAAGKSNASAVPMVRLDALALADRRDELQREVEQARVQLQRWVGAAANASLAGDMPERQVDGAHLHANLERSPEIAAFTPAQALAQAEIQEADAAKVGDWGWGVNYGRRGQGYGDLVSVQFTFELPLAPNERQQPLVQAKQKELERLSGERSDQVRKHQQELDTLLAENDEANRKLTRLTQEAQPLATQRSALTLAAYESGRDTLSAVLEARKQQTELRLRALELQAKRAAVQWRLNTLISE
ncbi:MAG: TolC family protein [Polaromonas sp.]|nr:TolC family protein [Polaromonas sp.]